MFLERTISQLDIGQIPPDQAVELGRLGYLQWLAGLPGDEDYGRAAMRAYEKAAPAIRTSPAISVFCDLLVASISVPPRPLPLAMPVRHRRGGALARRRRRTTL
ncbi:MAG: hypothetical protein AAFN17_05395 [Pseudomonadota bacterium]